MTDKPDRRRFPRADAREKAVILYDGRHQTCTLRDLSGLGAQVVTPARPEVGTEVVLFADEFGRFEGNIARHTNFGLGLHFRSNNSKLKRTLETLTDYASRIIRPGDLPKGPNAKRILLETLAVSGRVAATQGEVNQNFWLAVEDCRNRGWLSIYPVSPGISAIEITKRGRQVIGHELPVLV